MVRRSIFTALGLLTAGLVSSAGAQSPPPAKAPAAQAAPATQGAFIPFEGSIAAESLDKTAIGRELAIGGSVAEYTPSPAEKTPYRITVVKRETGGVELVFWPDLAPQILADSGVIKPGAKISAKGKVEDFKGRMQIRIRSIDQIRIEGAPATLKPSTGAASAAPKSERATPKATQAVASAEPIPPADEQGYYHVADIAKIKGALLGKTISIRGTAQEYTAPANDRAPHVFKMKDGEGQMEFVFWTGEGEKVSVPMTPGTVLYATGELQDYKGRLQISISNLKNISNAPLPKERLAVPKAKELSGGPAANAKDGWPGKSADAIPDRKGTVKLEPKQEIALREIGPQHVGNVVTIKGKVNSATAGEQGTVTLIVRGDGGYAYVKLPADLKDKPAVGDQVEIVGKVSYDQVRTAIVIEPVQPYEVKTIK